MRRWILMVGAALLLLSQGALAAPTYEGTDQNPGQKPPALLWHRITLDTSTTQSRNFALGQSCSVKFTKVGSGNVVLYEVPTSSAAYTSGVAETTFTASTTEAYTFKPGSSYGTVRAASDSDGSIVEISCLNDGTFSGGGGAPAAEYAALSSIDETTVSHVTVIDCDDLTCASPGTGSTRVPFYYNGSAWVPFPGAAAGIASVSADSAPVLGGNLDPNGKSIGERIYYVNTEAEFEAALTACGDGIGVAGQTGCTIQLEGGVIDISDGVTIAGATAGTQGRSGLVIRGAGGYSSVNSSGNDNVGTILNWTGAGAGSVLSIGACFGCEFHGFGINGNDLATAGIEVLSTSGAPAKLNVHDIGMWDINGTAILGNTSTGQFDESNFSNIMIRDSSKCFHSRHSQSLANVLGPNFICTQMNGTGPFIDIEYGGATLYNSYVSAISNSSTLVHLGSTANSLYVRDSVFEFGGVSSITAIDANDAATNSNVKRIIIDGNRFTYTTTGNVAIDADLRGYIAVTNNFANQPSGSNDITAPSISITNENSFGGNRTFALVQNNARQSLHAAYTDYPDPWFPSIGADVWLDPGMVVADSDDAPTTCLNGQTKIVNSTGALTACVSNSWIDPPNLAAVAGDTYTGAHDFGGATSVEVPNSAAPTTDATGEIALDTTITDHQPLLQYYDGSKNMSVIAIDTAELPALDNEIVKYDAATDKFVLEADAGGGGTPGGSDTQVQFNDGGSFGGDAGLVYNKTTDTLTVGVVVSGTQGAARGEFNLWGGGTNLYNFGILAPSTGSANLDLILPNTAPTDGYCLKASGTGGDLVWGACSAGGSSIWTDRGTHLTTTGPLLIGGDEDDTPEAGETLIDGGDVTADSYTSRPDATSGGSLVLNEGADDGSNTVSIKVPDSGLSGDKVHTLTADGLFPASSIAQTLSECFTLYNPTTNIADSDDIPSVWRAPAAITISEVWCESDETAATIQLQKDDSDGPANMLSAAEACDAGGTTSFVSGENVMADGDRLDLLMVTMVSTTTNRVNVCVEYSYN